jgi:hypothetical protein
MQWSTPLEIRITSTTRHDKTPSRTPTPFSGWALELAIKLDHDSPGLLAASFCFGRRRRQAMFLVLAAVREHGIKEIARRLRQQELATEFRDLEDAALLGRAVVRLRHPRDLVRAVSGSSPDGLLGALSRLGPDPLKNPDLYHELHRLFASTDPADRRRAKLLGQIEGDLVSAQIEILKILDPILMHTALLSKIHDVEHVADLHHALAYIRRYCSSATEAGIRASLGLLRPEGSRVDLVRAWSKRFDLLPHSLDTSRDPTLVVLGSAAAMNDAGRRYRNCLSSRISDVFLGTHLFAEYQPICGSEPGVIAELRRIERGFFLEGLYGVGNTRVRADRANLVRRKLAACGVALLDHAPASPEMMHAVAGMLGAWPLGVPDNNAWGEEFIHAVTDPERTLDKAA